MVPKLKKPRVIHPEGDYPGLAPGVTERKEGPLGIQRGALLDEALR